MIRVLSAVAALDLLQKLAQLRRIQLEVPDQACLLVQVEGQHGQRGPWSRLGKCKNVELPVGLCILDDRQTDRWQTETLHLHW